MKNERDGKCYICGGPAGPDYCLCNNCHAKCERSALEHSRANYRVSDVGPRGYTWAEWSEIVVFIAEVDYGCRFDDDGQCNGPLGKSSDGRNCCEGCSSSFGHHPIISPEALKTIVDLYDAELGFWRPWGCIMPPEYKSATCLGFQCDCLDHHDPDHKDKSKAWAAFNHLIGGPGYKDEPVPTIDKVRELMRGIGRLRESALVQLT